MWFDKYLENGKLNREGKNKLAELAVADLRNHGNLVEYTGEADALLLHDLLNKSEVLQRLQQPPHFHCWHVVETTKDKPIDPTLSPAWTHKELSRCCTCGKYRTRGMRYELPEDHGKYLPEAKWNKVYGDPVEWLEYPIPFGIPR